MTVDLRLLGVTDEEGRALFKLLKPYHYQLGPGCVVVVPAGYVTNFGTIPRWLTWAVSPAQLREAAIVHDYMTNEDLDGDAVPVFSGYSRWLADAVLYEAMARMGFGVVRRGLVYAAVRSYALITGQYRWPTKPPVLKV